MIERHFDISFIADLALREKQIQQNYRPPIAVHKWFARRPGTLFRGLILSEFVDRPLRQAFYENNDLHGLRIADPFMGGGTPLMEANRVGCDVVGMDINPMAYWIVRQEIEHLDLDAYAEAGRRLRQAAEREVGRFYRTACLDCGSVDAHVKYFLWVKELDCQKCGHPVRLFPGYVLAEDRRHPRNVMLCPDCGSLTETVDRASPGSCGRCGRPLTAAGPARRSRCACPSCGTVAAFPRPGDGPPRHSLFAIEYHCPDCRSLHEGRFFKTPDDADLQKLDEVEARWSEMRPRYVPEDEIPAGDETDRLHRWGYRQYRQMFNSRQLLGLELSCRLIHDVRDERVRNALATNLSDLLRYQNMLCRYDAVALKSLDIFSVHGFPVGLIQCESNLLGIPLGLGSGNVGSGGWSNIIEKFARAKEYCNRPFEYRHAGVRKTRVDLSGEWIGDSANGRSAARSRRVEVLCGDASEMRVTPASLDAVLTDPPYFGNVQYAELMDFCYVWLRRLVGSPCRNAAFNVLSTRNPSELTGNANMGRGIAHFADGLSRVFQRMAGALKPGRPLAFTYHHNDITAYFPVAVAILDSGLTCSASLPCPGEMGASIHISGTGSSIIDTVFVCRSTGSVPRKWITDERHALADLVRHDLATLAAAGTQATAGDIRCVVFGHAVRLAVWHLRANWDAQAPTSERMAAVNNWIGSKLGGVAAVLDALGEDFSGAARIQPLLWHEEHESYGRQDISIAF